MPETLVFHYVGEIRNPNPLPSEDEWVTWRGTVTATNSEAATIMLRHEALAHFGWAGKYAEKLVGSLTIWLDAGLRTTDNPEGPDDAEDS